MPIPAGKDSAVFRRWRNVSMPRPRRMLFFHVIPPSNTSTLSASQNAGDCVDRPVAAVDVALHVAARGEFADCPLQSSGSGEVVGLGHGYDSSTVITVSTVSAPESSSRVNCFPMKYSRAPEISVLIDVIHELPVSQVTLTVVFISPPSAQKTARHS